MKRVETSVETSVEAIVEAIVGIVFNARVAPRGRGYLTER